MLRVGIFATFALVVTAALLLGSDARRDEAHASPGTIVFRDAAFGMPHIYADTDLELARQNGREIAKDRLGQIILISRVARGTLYQAFGLLDASTFNDDAEVRRSGYTSSELNSTYDKLPADVRALILAYCEGVNDVIDDVYAGSSPEPAEVFLLRALGLGNDLFGNATNISDQVDPYYLAPGGADPQRPDGGFQFTPELASSIAVLQVRNFGDAGVNEVSLLDQLNRLIAKFPTDGQDIWGDLNFLSDPLAPSSVPDPGLPGFGGPLAGQAVSGSVAGSGSDTPRPAYLDAVANYDFSQTLAVIDRVEQEREERARSLGAWPALGSYAWMVDGSRSDTGNPWIGGFPQTGIQTPSIMHYVEMRSAEGADHQIETNGMEFIGAPLVLIGQSDHVAFTTTTGALKNNDLYLDQLILETTDALRYNDEGSPAPMSLRFELIKPTSGAATSLGVWRTHERGGNGGSRTIEGFQGNVVATADSATATTLTDSAAFASGSFAGGYVAIIAGTGIGQMRPIASSDANTLTLTGSWTVTPNNTSQYVAVKSGSPIIAISRERAFWLEETTTALGFSYFQRAESVLDIRRGVRLIPSAHHFMSADHNSFNGIGTDLSADEGNLGYYASGFWRVRQDGSDTRLPLDGTLPDPLVLISDAVGSATAGSLTSTGAFTGEDLSALPVNYRLDDPSQRGSEYIVTITGGAGYKQTRRIASNDDDTLTLEEDWGVTPAPGDTFEVYEIYGFPEAINPTSGYSGNWNNRAATADFAPLGRQHRVIDILERLSNDSSITRDDLRQVNKDVAGLDGKGAFGRFLIPRIREAVDGVGNGGNPQVDTVLAALETFQAAPISGRAFIDPVTATTTEGELSFLNSLISRLSSAIWGDELATTGIGNPGGSFGLDVIQHTIDSAAAGSTGAYPQVYTGDYFNSVDWRVVVRDAFALTITSLGGIPAHGTRGQSNYVHPLAALFPNLVFDQTPVGNRGIWEQNIEVGPTVKGEFVFPLGQSGFIDSGGLPSDDSDSLHDTWRDWRFAPMLHVTEDLPLDPDGDVDNDDVLDAFERWYYDTNSVLPNSDTDGDGLDLQGEYYFGSDPTDPDTDDDGFVDFDDNCAASRNPGQANLDGDAAGDDCDRDLDGDDCFNKNERLGDELRGGDRSLSNPNDYFNPSHDRQIRIDDILLVVGQYFKDDNDGTPGLPPYVASYDPDTDRTFVGPDNWDLGPPNGQQRVDDILNAVKQYFHDCA
jgi:hypothetical protein